MDDRKPGSVRALTRGLSILTALSQAEALSLVDLHRITELPKPTVLRLLATLEVEGYVGQRICDGRWRTITRRMTRGALTNESIMLDHSGPILRDLCKSVMWPSDVSVFEEGAMKVVETTRPLSPAAFAPFPINLYLPVLQSGMGRAWLAWSDEVNGSCSGENAADDLDDVSGERRLVILRKIKEETLRSGYGRRIHSFFRHLRPNVSGDAGMALPVIASNRVVGAVNLMWYRSAVDEPAFVKRHLRPLQEAVDAIGAAISKAERGAVTGANRN